LVKKFSQLFAPLENVLVPPLETSTNGPPWKNLPTSMIKAGVY